MRRTQLALLTAPFLLAGCATLGIDDDRAFSPAGQSLRVVAANGATSQMSFRQDGTVTARFNNREIAGRWSLRGDNLCFEWAGAARECWPYPAPFPRGRTVNVRSDRGNTVRVTAL